MSFSHVCIGANDLPRQVAFYDAVFGVLGWTRCWEGDNGVGWRDGPEGSALYIGRPFDSGPAAFGNGWMAAFRAADRASVDAAYAAAIAHGGTSEGQPGLRAYAPDYYGAYMRDPEGNKLHVVHRENWGGT